MAGNKQVESSFINVKGFKVELKKVTAYRGDKVESWYCSYVTLPKCEIFSESYLGSPTYREGERIGFDTAHYRNEGQSMDGKMLDAIRQVTWAINQYLKVTENYYEDDDE